MPCDLSINVILSEALQGFILILAGAKEQYSSALNKILNLTYNASVKLRGIVIIDDDITESVKLINDIILIKFYKSDLISVLQPVKLPAINSQV